MISGFFRSVDQICTLFQDITQRSVAILYWRFRMAKQTQNASYNYHSTLRNIPEECRSTLLSAVFYTFMQHHPQQFSQADTEQSPGHTLLRRLTVYTWYKMFKETPYLCRHPARHVRREGGMTATLLQLVPRNQMRCTYVQQGLPCNTVWQILRRNSDVEGLCHQALSKGDKY